MVHLELPDNWQDLAVGYVLNNLSEEEAWIWEMLLKEYPELHAETQTLEKAFNGLADIVPLYQPPASLLKKIHSTIETQSHQPQPQVIGQEQFPSSLEGSTTALSPPSVHQHRSPHVRPNPLLRHPVQALPHPSSWHGASDGSGQGFWRINRITQIGGVIVASIIAALVVQNHTLQTRFQQTDTALQQANTEIKSLNRQLRQARTLTQSTRPVVQTLQQPGSLIFSLTGSNLATTASGRLVMSEEQQVVLVVQNLPQLPEGKIYRLWAALDTKDVVYCGQFNSNVEGIIQLTPPSDHCGENPSQMLITLDAITDPTTQGGPVVMKSGI